MKELTAKELEAEILDNLESIRILTNIDERFILRLKGKVIDLRRNLEKEKE